MSSGNIAWIGLSTDAWNRIPLLMQKGWSISLAISLDEMEELKSKHGASSPLKTLPVPKARGGFGSILDEIECAKAILDMAPDLVVSDGSHPLTAVLIHLFAGKRIPQVMVVLSLPVPHRLRFIHRLYFAVSMLVAGFLNCACSVLTPIVGKEISKMSLGMLNPSVAPAGVDVEHFSPSAAPVPRGDLDIPSDALVVMYHGVVSKNRKLEFLLKVLSDLRGIDPRVILVIVGSGDDCPHLWKLANQLGLLDRLRFVGWVPFSRLPNYLALADINVTYIPEDLTWSTPYKTLEAMACGKTVVASNVPPVQEIETVAKCITIVDNNVADWVEGIRRASSSRATMNDAAARGLDYVRKNRSWEKSADILDSGFRGLSDRR